MHSIINKTMLLHACMHLRSELPLAFTDHFKVHVNAVTHAHYHVILLHINDFLILFGIAN